MITRRGLIARLKESEGLLERRVEERTAALELNERRLAEAQRLARIGSWEWNLSTSQITWSDQTYRLFGLEPGSHAPTYDMYVSLLHPDDRARVTQAITQTLETRQSFAHDHRVVRRDGSSCTVFAQGEVILNADRTPAWMVGTVQDVTDQRAASEALRSAEERLQLAARATNDALWDWDIPAGTVWWSQGFKTLFGHDAPPTCDVWLSLVHPDDAKRVGQSIEHFLQQQDEVWTAEYRFRCRDERYAWVLDRAFAMRGPDGSARRMVGSMMNITDRKEAERNKSDFVSFVSHQLRTPLSGMRWMLELAAEADGMPAEARGYIDDARESAHRLVSLVNDLLDIARLEGGRSHAVAESIDLDGITRSVLSELGPLAAAKRHHVVTDLQPAAPVLGDPQMARQVVLNLLSNAIKYTPPSGQILVSVRRQNGSVRWSVKDSGIGVPRRAQSRLFEKFYRADNVLVMEAEGTGLGLHLVRLIVEQAGGRVWCESEEGAGALFAFTWPVAVPVGEHG